MPNSKYFLFILFVFVLLKGNAQNDSIPVLWNLDNLRGLANDTVYKNEKYVLLWKADKYSKLSPVSVMDKINFWNSDLHNYQSLAIYFWPNEKNTNGPYAQKDGIMNPEYKQYDYSTLCGMSYRLEYMSCALFLTREKKYQEAIVKQLRTWFIDKNTRMYPHMEYGQVMPGINDNHGRSEGIIDSYVFHSVLESIRLTNMVMPIDKITRDALKEWFHSFLLWLNESEIGLSAGKALGNHGVNYDLIRYDMALFVGDKTTSQLIERNFFKCRIERQVVANGEQKYEIKRTRSYFYQLFNLTHIIDMSILIKQNKSNRSKRWNRTIIKIFQYLKYYADNPDCYPHQEIGNWEELNNALNKQIIRANRVLIHSMSVDHQEKYTSLEDCLTQ